MMKVKYYKCPICSKKFKTLNGWGNHMDTTHPENRPEGYSTSRYFYFVVTGKTHGVCRTCKGNTPWNEQSMKYDQYCTNPECKQAYAKMAKQRMVGKYGKVHLLNNPDMQKKMLENRKISGKYRFDDGTEFSYVGSYEKEFLRMMDKMMQWHTNDIIAPSPHTYYYNYKNPKDKKNEGVKFYIPDFYIPSLNLEIEIKQQTSGNKAMNDINRVKEALKDEVMNSNPDVNYLKINDNNFTPFFEFLMKAQEYLPTPENIKKNQMDLVMESFIEKDDDIEDKPIITKIFEVEDKEGYKNQCIMVNGYSKPLRGRSEMLIIKDDMVYLSLRNEDKNCPYKLPGGGWDSKDKDHMESAIRETQEEVRINVKNVKPAGIRLDYDSKPAKWVIDKVPKENWWYGYYSEIYIGEYNGNYTGKIKAHDKDDIINTGKFYKISDVYHKLKPSHQRAINMIMAKEDPSIATEGLLSFLNPKKNKEPITMRKWIDTFQIKKNLLSGFGYYGVRVKDGMIEIHGINFNILQNRIKRYYNDKSINNIFIPKYNAMSYKRFEKKKIQRCEIKIDYMTSPEFFALELVRLFTDLGKRYRDKVYLSMANKIYNNTWLVKADEHAETIPFLNTRNLKNISLELNPYQKEFIEKYPKLKAQLNLNGYILAFEQGLGKTLTAIGLSECLDVDHVYIVCPNSLKENWALEIKKYYKKYEDDDLWRQEVFICSDKQIYFNPDTTKYLIINNESIEKMFPYVMSGKNMMILDESHNFRNLQSKRVGQLLELKDKLKCIDTLVMSGTPIKATPDEIVPSLMLIDPTFTITAATCFTKAFKLKSSIGTSLVETRFGKIMYRKEKDVLENKLPDKHVDTLNVVIADKTKYTLPQVNTVVMDRFSQIYDSGIDDAKKLREPFMRLSKEYSPQPERYNEFVKLIDDMVKKEIYLHEIDQMFVEKYMKDVTEKLSGEDKKYYIFLIKNFVRYKAHCLGVAFGEILPKYRRDMFISMYSENRGIFFKMIKDNTKKTLIFTQFKGVANYIYHDLCDNGIGSVCITGDVKNRMEILRAFKENDAISVLVATSQTIGTGVTLVEANQMFFFGPPWRQSDFDQCSDRIHRIGQTDEVYIYSVILDTGAELNLSTRMDDILIWSKKMTEAVINKSEDTEDIDENHFEELLKAEESVITTNGDDIFEKVKAFNRELNSWDYGVLIDGKKYTDSNKIDWSKYKTIPIKDIDKHHVGICWDFVNYQHNWFSQNKIKDDSYFFVMQLSNNPNDIVTHTFSIITISNKKYWFESSWYKHQGVTEVKSYSDVIDKLIDRYDKNKNNDYSVFKYNPNGLDSNVSNGEFFRKATSNCIYNYQKNVSNESYYRITFDDKGIYDEFKKRCSKNEWQMFKNSTACSWLPTPPSYGDNNRSYFTKNGFDKFMKDVYPIISKKFNKDEIKISEYKNVNKPIYSDKYQIVTEACKNPLENKEVKESNIDNLLSTNIAQETYLFSKDSIMHKINDFKSGKSNILLITGISGSGKSTMAYANSKAFNATIIELDLFDQNYKFVTDKELRKLPEPLYIYLTRTTNGKKFRKQSLSQNKPTGNELIESCRLFGNWLLSWCENHKDTKWIIEGVHIYECFDFNIVKKYPIIINGVSMAKSIKRRFNREGYEGEFIKMVDWYLTEEKKLNEFRKAVSIETFISDDTDLLNQFLCIPDNE